MHEATTIPTLTSDTSENLTAAARQAESWFGEPFLAPDEDPLQALAPGTARRAALDDALAEIESGLKTPSSRWKVRYGLMLGLERVLTEDPARTAAGTELRRHQIDALTGMLAELIAATQRPADENGNGNGHASTNGTAAVAEADLDEEADDDYDAGFIDDDEALEAEFTGADPGAVRRFRFRHPTASGKTIAAAGFVEAARNLGVLILTHRRLLVAQFKGDLTTEGYADRFTDALMAGATSPTDSPLTIQTYAWFARHGSELDRNAYHLVICDEAHTALGEKTSAAIRAFSEPLFIGMTATEQLIAKQVSDVFPASVDDLPLSDAARRGLIAPLRCLRVPPAAAINSVPIVGGDFEERALAAALDHEALNQAAASLYRERFGSTPGIVYAAGVEHAYNLAQEFRAAGNEGGGRLGTHASSSARRDAGGVRAWRDQRPRSTPCCSPRAGTHRARRCACTSRRPRRGACTSSASAASCASTRGRRPASSSTSSRRVRRIRSASFRSTHSSTRTSTARARASRPPRDGVSNDAHAASSPRFRGSFRSRPTSRDGSP